MASFTKIPGGTRNLAAHEDEMRKKRVQMERLKALRLAREAEEAASKAATPPAPKAINKGR